MTEVRSYAEYVPVYTHFYLRVDEPLRSLVFVVFVVLRLFVEVPALRLAEVPVRGLVALLPLVRAGADAAGVRVVLVVPDVRTRVVVVLSAARDELLDVRDEPASLCVRVLAAGCAVVVRVLVA